MSVIYYFNKLDTLEKMNCNWIALRKDGKIIRNNKMNSNVELNKDASVSDLFVSLNCNFSLEDKNGLLTFLATALIIICIN
ncbi:DUF4806 domain-containing protein, partial [Aphis craccivora]